MAKSVLIRISESDYNKLLEIQKKESLLTIPKTLSFLLKKFKRVQALENTIETIHIMSNI